MVRIRRHAFTGPRCCTSTPFRGNIVMLMMTMPILLPIIGLRVGSTELLFFLTLFTAGKVNFFFHLPAEEDITRSFASKSQTITTNLSSLTFAFLSPLSSALLYLSSFLTFLSSIFLSYSVTFFLFLMISRTGFVPEAKCQQRHNGPVRGLPRPRG